MKIITKILNNILSKKLILNLILIKNLKYFLSNYYYDFKRFIFSSSTLKVKSEKNIESKISANYHALEKGLAMSDKKKKFGIKRTEQLIKHLENYSKKKFNCKSSQISSSIKVLYKYFKYHEKLNDEEIVNLEKKFKNLINNITTSDDFEGGSKEIIFNKNANLNKSFKEIAESRNSVRDFSDAKLDLSLLKEAIRTASNTPTTCNRQPNKVYYLNDKEKIKNILKLQNGNSGWGSKINNLLICTTDLQYFSGITDRNQAQIDGGMFCMSLVYALEEYSILNCTLNWSVDSKQDNKLRKIINISNSEIIIMMIAIGLPPEKYLVANSQKRDIDEILFYL